MIARNFEYKVATSLNEAIGLLQEHGDNARILAGGHSLIPMMKLRLATPDVLIDIGRLPELSYVTDDGSTIRIGALASHHVIESSEALRKQATALQEAAGRIGDIQVRNKGTIGGSIAHADPAADYPASLLAFDTTVIALGPKGEREIPASDFFVDMMTTALAPHEIVREIRIPLRKGKTGSAYLKFAQKASGFAICGAAALVEFDNAGVLAHVAVGITGVANHAFRVPDIESALVGKAPTADLLRTACANAGMKVMALDDIHASGEYRIDLARTFARRALEKAIERAR